MAEGSYLFAPNTATLSLESDYRKCFSILAKNGVGVLPTSYMSLGLYAKVSASFESSLLVSADGADMTVDIAKGAAELFGQLYYSDAIQTLTIEAADPTNPRIDLVVIEFSTATVPATATIKIVKGTPAASPSAPSLTYSTTVVQRKLAQVLVGNGVTVIAADKVYDDRQFCTQVRHIHFSYGDGNALAAGYIIPATRVQRSMDIIRASLTLDAVGSATIVPSVQAYASSPSFASSIIGTGTAYSISSAQSLVLGRTITGVLSWTHIIQENSGQFLSLYLSSVSTAKALSGTISFYDLGERN